MPYYNVGVVKNATKEALLNLEFNQTEANLKVHVTGHYPDAIIELSADEKTIFETTVNLDPANGFEQSISIGNEQKKMKATVFDKDGAVLVSYIPDGPKTDTLPNAATAAKSPDKIESIEELFLNGLHLEQYRHATYNASAYYLEGLRRSPNDVRCNNAMGQWYLKRGRFKKALPYFQNAIKSLTQRNPNPYDGEPYFNLGLSLRFLGKEKEAYDAFYKACWNAAWQDAGYFNLAQLECSQGNFIKALELVDKALVKNWHNHKARHLKTILLRKLNKAPVVLQIIEDSLQIDRLNLGVLFEKYLMYERCEDLQTFKTLSRNDVHTYIEYALDYASAGQFSDAITLLELNIHSTEIVYPIALYFLADYHRKIGNITKSRECYGKARTMPMDYCFPNRLEEVVVLQNAIFNNEEDARAPYYLGNFWYAARQYDKAQDCWETAMVKEPENAICQRNLALLYFNKNDRKQEARKRLEKAFELSPDNARVLMELDQLYKKMNVSIAERLVLLEKNSILTESRDDLYLERVALYNISGEHAKALELIKKRQFHPWEGGEGKVPFQYLTAQVERAKQLLAEKDWQQAIAHLEAAQNYPPNLGEGKLYGTQENDIFYWLGVAYLQAGESEKAETNWEKAAIGLSELGAAMFYNDQQPDRLFYQGLALLRLERDEEAAQFFESLTKYGKKHLNDEVKLDYFAISLPDLLIWEEDLNDKNKVHCQYLIGLGELGQGKLKQAKQAFASVLAENKYHLPAALHQRMTTFTGL